MKTHQGHLYIEIPEGATHIALMSFVNKLFYTANNVDFEVKLPPGRWEIVADSSTIIEEQIKELGLIKNFYDIDGIRGWNDQHGGIWSNIFKAFQSLLTSLGLTRAVILKEI